MLQSRRASGAADRGRERGPGGRAEEGAAQGGRGPYLSGPGVPPLTSALPPGPCGSERDRTAMNEKKRGGGGAVEMGTKQAAFPGAGTGLGPPPGRVGLGATAGARGVTLAAGGGPWQAHPRPTLPPWSEPAQEPLPADPSMCLLDFSSVHLLLLQFGGK